MSKIKIPFNKKLAKYTIKLKNAQEVILLLFTRIFYFAALELSIFVKFKVRIALSTAINVTPTSAKIANHIGASPKLASISTSILTDKAKAMF